MPGAGAAGNERASENACIDEKLTRQPLKFGIPLSGGLADFRKLRIGDYRVVYHVQEKMVLVYVLAVGPRRDKEIYRLALKRK